MFHFSGFKCRTSQCSPILPIAPLRFPGGSRYIRDKTTKPPGFGSDPWLFHGIQRKIGLT